MYLTVVERVDLECSHHTHTKKEILWGDDSFWWWFCNILCNIYASNHHVIYNLNVHSVKCQLYFNKAGIQIKA